MGYSTQAAKQALHQARGNLDDALKVMLPGLSVSLGIPTNLAGSCDSPSQPSVISLLSLRIVGDGVQSGLFSSRARVMALDIWPGALVTGLPNLKGLVTSQW